MISLDLQEVSRHASNFELRQLLTQPVLVNIGNIVFERVSRLDEAFYSSPPGDSNEVFLEGRGSQLKQRHFSKMAWNTDHGTSDGEDGVSNFGSSRNVVTCTLVSSSELRRQRSD